MARDLDASSRANMIGFYQQRVEQGIDLFSPEERMTDEELDKRRLKSRVDAVLAAGFEGLMAAAKSGGPTWRLWTKRYTRAAAAGLRLFARRTRPRRRK